MIDSMSEKGRERESCLIFVEELLRRGLNTDGELARLSICLGALEASLTNKISQQWPSDLEVASAGPVYECKVLYLIC